MIYNRRLYLAKKFLFGGGLGSNNNPINPPSSLSYGDATEDQRRIYDNYQKDLKGYNDNIKLFSTSQQVKSLPNGHYSMHGDVFDKAPMYVSDNYESFTNHAGKDMSTPNGYTNLELFKPTYGGAELTGRDDYLNRKSRRPVDTAPIVSNKPGRWVRDPRTGKMVVIGGQSNVEGTRNKKLAAQLIREQNNING